MSLISESYTELDANKLEGILKNGLETKNKSVIKFLRREVYPLYKEDIEELLGAYEENEEIRKGYAD